MISLLLQKHAHMLTGFACVFLATACSASEDQTGTKTQELRGGIEITGYQGVVDISVLPPGYQDVKNCTGSMISANAVLTAAHCVRWFSSWPNTGTIQTTINYYDPETGRRQVYSGQAEWFSEPNYNPDLKNNAGRANSDIAIVRVPKTFSNTSQDDYLGIYAGRSENLQLILWAYGAGLYTYSGKKDDKLRAHYFNVEDVDPSHIVLDTRKKVGLCKGDSGGPLIFPYAVTGGEVGTVTGVGSSVELFGGEPDVCANNDWGMDDAFYSRTNMEKLGPLLRTAGQECAIETRQTIDMVVCRPMPVRADTPFDEAPDTGANAEPEAPTQARISTPQDEVAQSDMTEPE